MKHFRDLLFVILGFVLGIVLIVGCAANVEEEASSPEKEVVPQETVQVDEKPGVKQAQNEEVTEDCDAIRSELETVQAKYEALQSENSELNNENSKLSDENNELNDKNSELNAQLTTLSADYDELTSIYNNILEGTPDITESDVEQAVFKIINKGRQDSGLDEVEWANSYQVWAKQHSDYLASKNLVVISDGPYWQGVFRAAGYSSLDRMANAAWIVWKENITFESNFLNQHAKYGAVGVTKSGDIFYITYFSSSY
ncbi:CAP domain-containing protein [Chloroflexota bacterium]